MTAPTSLLTRVRRTHLVASIIARHSRNSLCFGFPSVVSHTMIEDGSCGPVPEEDAMLGDLIEPERRLTLLLSANARQSRH